MFESEDRFQQLIHEKPEIVLSGIPEISPQFCPDAPSIVSLGREIPLSSGPIDNLYIDTNAILTFVECKRYSDSRLKREVYAQTINYASDLVNMLTHYTTEQFCTEFFRIVSYAQSCPFNSLNDIIAQLAEDPILKGRNLDDWRSQFIQRLEYNIKRGVCRIVIACAPSPDNAFAYSGIRNLIQLMNYSEAQNSRYDLILMDIRGENDNFASKIIWRSYAQLPQIPLIAQATRDTAAGVEKMLEQYKNLPAQSKQQLDRLIDFLNNNHTYLVKNTYGFAVYSNKDKKSLYVLIIIEKGHWHISRHQIASNERLYNSIEADELTALLPDISFKLDKKKTSKGEPMFEINITPKATDQPEQLGRYMLNVLGYASKNSVMN